MNNAKKIFAEGLKFYKKGNLDAAIEAWSSINREDDRGFYAESRFNLGVLYKERGCSRLATMLYYKNEDNIL